MSQLLDRYRRVSDGKEFAVVSLGAPTNERNASAKERSMTLEAEDGERVERRAAPVPGQGRFERIED